MLVEHVKLAFSKFGLVFYSIQMSLETLFTLELLSAMVFADNRIIVKDRDVSF